MPDNAYCLPLFLWLFRKWYYASFKNDTIPVPLFPHFSSSSFILLLLWVAGALGVLVQPFVKPFHHPQPISSAQLCSVSNSQSMFAFVRSSWAQPKAVSDSRQLDGQPPVIARRGQGLKSSEAVAPGSAGSRSTIGDLYSPEGSILTQALGSSL